MRSNLITSVGSYERNPRNVVKMRPAAAFRDCRTSLPLQLSFVDQYALAENSSSNAPERQRRATYRTFERAHVSSLTTFQTRVFCIPFRRAQASERIAFLP